MLQVTYLHHSGFLINNDQYSMIFDYYTENGRYDLIDPNQLADKEVYVFVSHVHQDHFDPVIFSFRTVCKKIHYIISDDIKLSADYSGEDVQMVHFNKEYCVGDVTVNTLQSTDAGVAFLVKGYGNTIYHGGDLHWWHWNGESDQFNRSIGGMFKKAIDRIKGTEIDIAFIPVDLRLEENYLLGFQYTMDMLNIHNVFPMHFWNDYTIFEKMMKEESISEHKNKVQIITKHGQIYNVVL